MCVLKTKGQSLVCELNVQLIKNNNFSRTGIPLASIITFAKEKKYIQSGHAYSTEIKQRYFFVLSFFYQNNKQNSQRTLFTLKSLQRKLDRNVCVSIFACCVDEKLRRELFTRVVKFISSDVKRREKWHIDSLHFYIYSYLFIGHIY